jgi:apolipoprotein N-acyltransferase
MKKTLYSLFFLPIILFSSLDMNKVNSVLVNIQAPKELKFYAQESNSKIDKNILLTTLKDADIVLFPEENENYKMAIVNSYKKLKLDQNNIGAIYQKKDRTQIVFIVERLKSHGLALPKIFNRYLISESQLNPVTLLLNHLNRKKITK